jgi:hypothetical protein
LVSSGKAAYSLLWFCFIIVARDSFLVTFGKPVYHFDGSVSFLDLCEALCRILAFSCTI